MSLLRLVARLACLLLTFAATPTLAAMYDMPPSGSDVVGKIQHIKTKKSDTFVALARKYDVGYREMREANPDVDPWLPGDDTPVIIPTAYVLPNVPRQGVVVNLPEMRVYFFPPDDGKYAGKVFTYPIGIGRQGWSTPVTHTKVTKKVPYPTWTPPASIKKEHAEKGDPLPDVVPAGPGNPLGQYKLRLGLPGYLIHGTNNPTGVGMRVSHGCIRLFPEDISALFSMVKAGTPVNIISEPYKVGWKGDTLMMEVHPPDTEDDAPVKSYTPWVQALIAATKDQPKPPVDWERAEDVVHDAGGIPEAIGKDSHKHDPRTTSHADASSS